MLLVPFRVRLKAGGVITFVGSAISQATYWFLEAIDPRPGKGPWPPVGSLRWQTRRTDPGGCAANIYVAPEYPPRIRFGMGYRFGEARFGQESGLYDRLRVEHGA